MSDRAQAGDAGSAANEVPGPWLSLTPAELAVIELVAEGLTNREIGAELYVSHRTVASHLSHVYRKLGLTSRVQVAAEAARRSR